MEDSLALVPRQARRFQGEPAGVVTRSLAAAVDIVVVGAALVASYAGLNAALFIADPRDFQAMRVSFGVGLATALAVCVVYLTAAWAATGRTYGKRVMGVRVMDRHRRPLRLIRALVRAVLCVGFPIGLFWSLPSASRSSMQDVLLGTSVIHDWPPHSGDADETWRTGPDDAREPTP